MVLYLLRILFLFLGPTFLSSPFVSAWVPQPLAHRTDRLASPVAVRLSSSASPPPPKKSEKSKKSRAVRAPRPMGRHKFTGGSRPRSLRVQGELLPNASGTARLRILGGSRRGRILLSPSVHLRPMMGKVKEALFSTLTSFGLYDASAGGPGPRHLDVFAGSGSVGLESLSRGAAWVTFVDAAEDCCDTARNNLEMCGFGEAGDAVCGDAFRALRDPASVGIDLSKGPYEIITLTPPYEEISYDELIDAVVSSPLCGEDTVVVVEYPVELGSLPHVLGGRLVGVRNRKYGRTVLGIYVCNPSGRMEVAGSRPEEFL